MYVIESLWSSFQMMEYLTRGIFKVEVVQQPISSSVHRLPCLPVGDWQRGWTDRWLSVRGGPSQAARTQTGLRQAQRPRREEGCPPHHQTTRGVWRGRLNRPQLTPPPPHALHNGTFWMMYRGELYWKHHSFKNSNSHQVHPETELCTPRTTEQRHTLQNFHL